MEKLPFADQSFDLIVSAGSLSYGDNDIVMNEIYRVLKLIHYFVTIITNLNADLLIVKILSMLFTILVDDCSPNILFIKGTK
jgi:ubiquinone/menaquinone biosynthesis C-methylase UbiE